MTEEQTQEPKRYFDVQKFRERLQICLDYKGMTHEQLSQAMGTDAFACKRYLAGIIPATPMLFIICRELDVSADYLLGIVDA